jgi:DNA repair exonuclease SbcCD ATPase subunit
VGDNGAGKSTILDAITFALFGKPYRNINKTQIINSVNRKECVVELDFLIGDKAYLIRRGIKPTIFEIWVDGALLNQAASVKDYQEMLERSILKMNYKSFTQIVILGSASFTPFMQLTAADRRAVIEDLLDIQIFSCMNQIVKEKLSDLKTSLTESRIKLDSTKEKIELQKRHIEEMKKSSLELINQKQEEIDKAKADIDQLQTENATQEKTVTDLLDKNKTLSSAQAKHRKLIELRVKIQTNKHRVLEDSKFYKSNDTCPTCKQGLQDHFKLESIALCDRKIEEFDDGLSKLSTELETVLEKLEKIEGNNTAIRDLQSKVANNNTSIQHMQRYITKLNQEIRDLESKMATNSQFRDTTKMLLDEFTELMEVRRIDTEDKMYYDSISLLLKDGGIKSRIIKQYLPIINKQVNKYLSAMDFFVNFHMDEEFKETIKSRNRDDFSYANFSEGEKTRINLSLLFTWRSIAKIKNSVNTNLLILDEVFDSSLDTFGVDCLVQLLSSMSDSNIFIISHKGDAMQDKFQQVVKFEKKGNFSHKRQ